MVPQWLIAAVGIMLLVVMALFSIGKGYDLKKAYDNKNPENTLTVSAEGKKPAIPDLAVVSLGVLTEGKNPSAIQEENSKKINKIIDYIKSQDVAKEDISTSQYNIYPQYDYSPTGQQSIRGYQLNQTITIKIRGVDKSTERLGKILSGATNEGVNQINGVNVMFDDPDNLRQEARKMAIEKAKQKAQELAAAAGIELGRVVTVSESGYSAGPMPYYADGGYGGAGVMSMEKAVSPNIEPGQQDVTATMTVTFEIK